MTRDHAPLVQEPLNISNTNLSRFDRALKGRDLELQLEAMDVFSEAMRNNSVPFFMYGGTLVGSWRHHGLVPWDDDIDFFVPRAKEDIVHAALSCLEPHFHLDTNFKIRWKFYSNQSHPYKSKEYKWPYIDINFYLSNDTHLWDEDVERYSKYIFRMDSVFPLRMRPFMGRMLPAPSETEVVLSVTYDLQICKKGDWNHREEDFNSVLEQRAVSCKLLQKYYPFVHHVRIGSDGCNELLVQNGNEVIGVFYRDYGNCS